MKDKNSLRLVSWNVNGLRSVLRKGFVGLIKDLNADIVCLQEVKARAEDIPDLKDMLPHYHPVWAPGQRKGYSGVATFIHDTVTRKEHSEIVSLHSDTTLWSEDPFQKEGRVLITHIGDLKLHNLYFPSGTTGDERQAVKYKFLDYFSEYLEHIPKSQRKNLVICGDFNICHQEIDIHHPREAARRELSGFLPKEREWMDRFVSLGLVDAFRQLKPKLTDAYSWWTYRANAREKNLGWRIDYFFISQDLVSRLINAEIHSEIKGSDHCPISIELRS